MQDAIVREIFEWSWDRPGWQRDAFARLFRGDIAQSDIDDLTELCKAAHGLSGPRKPVELTKESLPAVPDAPDSVSLASVTHHQGVNALAPEQTISFGPQLTIVYGANAAGKSGFTRILKQACRSRFSEGILGNVLGDGVPLKASSTLRFRQGAVESSFEWPGDVVGSSSLTAISVFDAHCVPIYLKDKTDVAFRPFGLDLFDKLSALCGEVRNRLEKEQAALNNATPRFPSFGDGTRAKQLTDNLTALTKIDDVRRLAMLSDSDRGRLRELREKQKDIRASDPKLRARELMLKAGRMDSVTRRLSTLFEVFGENGIGALVDARRSLQAATSALTLLKLSALPAGLLPGTGEPVWKKMWDSANTFAVIAYPDKSIPTVSGSICPLCQQFIEDEAAARLQHFSDYVSSNAQGAVRVAESRYTQILTLIRNTSVERPEIDLVLNELEVDEPTLAQSIRDYFGDAIRIKLAITTAAMSQTDIPLTSLESGPTNDLKVFIKQLQERTSKLQTLSPSMDAVSVAVLAELESQELLHDNLQMVLDEIDRKQRLAAYKQCLDDTSTLMITRKSTELTKRLVTDQLHQAFQAELKAIGFDHLSVEIKAAGGSRGALLHHLVFTDAPGVVVTSVLSEGESRTLSLAAFLTELSTAPSKSGIIFDDPVSSLDHVWRERIAKRLVAEGKHRQVIIFTHDLLFLRLLMNEAEQEKLPCSHQYIRRIGRAGICSSDLPWVAMRIKERLGVLRKRWQETDKLYRTQELDKYETNAREIYGMLREAWEQAISEVLLNDVVDRYRPSIESQKVRFLHDITPEDCTTVNAAMTECSRWIRGHDAPPADGTPFPNPESLNKSIQELESWVQKIRKRR